MCAWWNDACTHIRTCICIWSKDLDVVDDDDLCVEQRRCTCCSVYRWTNWNSSTGIFGVKLDCGMELIWRIILRCARTIEDQCPLATYTRIKTNHAGRVFEPFSLAAIVSDDALGHFSSSEYFVFSHSRQWDRVYRSHCPKPVTVKGSLSNILTPSKIMRMCPTFAVHILDLTTRVQPLFRVLVVACIRL